MKNSCYSYLGCCIAIVTSINCLGDLRGASFFSPRSQGANTARELVGNHRFTNKTTPDTWHGTCSITPEYLSSFRSKRLAQYFFGTDTLAISGSQAGYGGTIERGGCDLLADYFGLSPRFSSTVSFAPKVRTFLTDFALNIGYDAWHLRVHTPLVWTKHSLCLKETIKNVGDDVAFPANYMTNQALNAPFSSWCQAMQGCTTWGDTQGLKAGRICGAQSAHTFADISCDLGYTFVDHEQGHAGFSVHMVIPTGTRPWNDFLFEPMIGNGKHWELGLGFDGSSILWEKDGNQQLELLVTLQATHLFKSCQRRSFDFSCKSYYQDDGTQIIANGFASRYMLLKEFDTTGAYANKLHPAINQTTLRCDVDTCIQFDGTVAFGYQYEGFGFDLGYNAWVRSRERICNVQQFPDKKFGFKGIQDAIGNKTQSTSTIFGNKFTQQATVADKQPPLFVSMQDLDVESAAAPCQFTHKIFWHFSHAWEHNTYIPYFGIGGEVEFEGYRPKDIQPNKPSMAQWGLWLKGGLSF